VGHKLELLLGTTQEFFSDGWSFLNIKTKKVSRHDQYKDADNWERDEVLTIVEYVEPGNT
jgi:hypothetical protein